MNFAMSFRSRFDVAPIDLTNGLRIDLTNEPSDSLSLAIRVDSLDLEALVAQTDSANPKTSNDILPLFVLSINFKSSIAIAARKF
jgi:hypothetical protein